MPSSRSDSRAGRLDAPVYVHAKIGIVDDRWLTIGSSNLNEHSLFNDTRSPLEADREEQLARRLRGEALTHRLARLPHVSRRSRRLLGALDNLLVDG